MDEDNVVISGISGRFPMCRNVEEFSKNLYGKVDMVSDAEYRVPDDLYQNIPKRRGIIDDLNKFDAAYFHLNAKQAEKMSPESRILLELATEAILDAGINPVSMIGSNTAVCLSQSTYDSMFTGLYTGSSDLLSYLGSSSVISVNRVSFSLGLRGISISVDAACAASFVALQVATNWIRQGESDAVLVLATNVQSHPIISKIFASLDVLNPDGCSRPFDNSANGYVRSDTIAAILLQKRKDAKRIYANIEHVICNHDGFKVDGITHPCGESQSELFEKLYKKVGVDPLDVHFVEAHGTGTKVGDPEECYAIDKVFCKNRTEPLLIGSNKSNMGHSEGASGLCSLIKAIFTFQTGSIPPNINFSEVRLDIPALASGRLKVCTESTPLKGSFIGINVFGLGGVNGHALLRKEENHKKNVVFDQNLPRLICWSGRTQEAVRTVFEKLKSIPIHIEFIGLLHNIQRISIKENLHRGYILLNTPEEVDSRARCVDEKISVYDEVKRPIVWVFSGMGSQYPKMAQQLMKIQPFADSITKCHKALKHFGLDLVSLLTIDESAFDNILHSFVAITAVQIALVDLLKLLEVPVDYYVGHSMGEICCAYTDGAITLEEAIISSYYRGKCSVDGKTVDGAMAAIGMGYNKIKDSLPPSIQVACHNSLDSCTISGPKNDILKYVDELRSNNVFAKEVSSGNIAYHSKYVANVGPKLLQKLETVIPNKVERSSKWLSTSNPIDQWHTNLAKFSSASYFVNNFLSPVYFEETCNLLPENAIIIEIAPNRLLLSILKKMFPNAIYVPLTFCQHENQNEFLLMALGKLYMNGMPIQIDRLYPAVNFPVSRGTPMISPLIKWNHEKDWPISQNKVQDRVRQIQKTIFINSSHAKYKFIDGYRIDGRCIIPPMLILSFVKDAVISAGEAFWLDGPIQSLTFENIKFLSMTELKPSIDVKISISIQLVNGRFEVFQGATLISSGSVKCSKKPSQIRDAQTFYNQNDLPILNSADVYKEFRLRGYNFADQFKSIDNARMDGCYGQIRCSISNWTTFMDAMIQMTLLSKDTRSLHTLAEIRRIRINVNDHIKWIENTNDFTNGENLVDVYHSNELSCVVCDGIEMSGFRFTPLLRIQPEGREVLQTYQFVPLMDAVVLDLNDAVGICVEFTLEKLQKNQVTLVEVLSSESKSTIDCFYEVFQKTPLIFADLTLLTGDNGISLVDNGSIKCECWKSLEEYSDCTVIVLNKGMRNKSLLELAGLSLSADGFLILIDDTHDNVTTPHGFTVITQLKCMEVTLTLMQRTPTEQNDDFKVIQIDSGDEHFEWLQKIQESNASDNVLLIAQNDKTPGVLGLFNCLRLEPDTKHLRCFIIEDECAPLFDTNASLYKKQLDLQLPVNIYRDAKWGTYRHLQLKENAVQCETVKRMTVNIEEVNGSSSVRWVVDTELRPTNEIIRVQYAALNFCDRLIAAGSLPSHTITKNRFDENRSLLGFEYAGITENQKRVMCFSLRGGSLSTQSLYTNADIVLEVPVAMSLRDAATIPLAYFTVYCSFFLRNSVESAQSILISAGCDGVGLAAIQVTLAYGLNVFTAVPTQEKKAFLLKNFPQLKAKNVGNSSDCSFEELIMNETNGEGTDFVLNSLSDDKQQASIRCLRRGGTFFELGKFDVNHHSEFVVSALRNGINIQPIVVEQVIKVAHERNKVVALMKKDLERGVIQPLPSTLFKADDVDNAFKFLTTGECAGKVLVQIGHQENSECSSSITVWRRALFEPELVYVLVGGLGGFGLELADWMIMRGARILVFCSRRGVSDQYQQFRIRKWESYGCTIVVSLSNVTTINGCKELLSTSTEYGEIGGIFNLAAVLRDGILTNQTSSKFSESFAPKVIATSNLDNISRTMCPRLAYFVVFSSFTSGYGNPGQSNYGMANSILDKIIEQRRRSDLPGTSIQWATIGDVGIVANLLDDKIRVDLRGTLPKRIDTCLRALDKLLTNSEPIVGCMQLATKKEMIHKLSAMDSIFEILAVDQKSITSNAKLTHLGMDSLMAVEVREMLKREFNMAFDSNEIKELTIDQLNNISKLNQLRTN